MWIDPQGNVIHGTTDRLGNKTYRDRNGNMINCRRDYFGNTTCR
jgi:hypothetical protein